MLYELETAAPVPRGLAERGYRFCYAFRVRYRDIDAQGIVFNGNYMAYIDYGITEYFRHLGIRLNQVQETGFDVAVVRAVQEFRAPAFCDDILHIGVRVVRIGRSSFTAQYCIWREEDGGTVILDAEVTYVNYDPARRRSRPIPARVRQAILAFEGAGCRQEYIEGGEQGHGSGPGDRSEQGGSTGSEGARESGG